MARNLSSLATSMRERATKLDDFGNAVAKEATEAAFRNMIEIMPVDTSEAISNTRIGIGRPPAGTVRPHFSGSRGSTRSSSSARALELGLGRLSGKQPGQTVYLSNTAKHIGELNRGSSPQFTGGFIPRALLIIHYTIAEAATRLLR